MELPSEPLLPPRPRQCEPHRGAVEVGKLSREARAPGCRGAKQNLWNREIKTEGRSLPRWKTLRNDPSSQSDPAQG